MILQASSGGEKEVGGAPGVPGRLIPPPKHRGCFSIMKERFGDFSLMFLWLTLASDPCGGTE